MAESGQQPTRLAATLVNVARNTVHDARRSASREIWHCGNHLVFIPNDGQTLSNPLNTSQLYQKGSIAVVNRFGFLFFITHVVIVIPQVRQLLTEPRSLGLGITSLLFVIGLWMMRKTVATSNGEFFKNFADANNGLFSLWLNLGRFIGIPIVAIMTGSFGLISIITGTVHLVEGTPLMDISVPDWTMLPNLIFGLGVACLMWGLHLRPEQVKEQRESAGIAGLLRELFIDTVIAIQANRFLFLLIP